MKKEEKEEVVPENLQKKLGSLAETRDNAIRINEKERERKMETVFMILGAAFIVGLIALVAIFGDGGNGRQVASNRRDDDGTDCIFSDTTDPAKSYLIGNIYHDDSAMEDSSFNWDDSSTMDDMPSSSWDD
jgi:hypothetical protein